MDQPNDRVVQPQERQRSLMSGSGAAVLVLAALIVGSGLFGTKAIEAQQGATRAPQPARLPMKYRQTQTLWTNMADTLNKWEEKGWETYQIVPIQAANPGLGGPMTVAIVFRRPAN